VIVAKRHKAGAAHIKPSIIGIDLAKNVFAIHGLDEGESVVLKRTLRRGQVLGFFGKLEPCIIGMEACAGAHYWGRELGRLGHRVRLMPAAYVKAYVKRGKTDAADAEAICEAVTRPTMRFVPVKSQEQQGVLTLHRVRDVLVRQRTQTVNVLRSLIAEFGVAAAKGKMALVDLAVLVRNDNDSRLPDEARLALRPLVVHWEELSRKIAGLEREIVARSRADERSGRLETIPGIGPITAGAMIATLGDPKRFSRARDLAAWIGLTPRPCCSGGKERLASISKQGDPYLRRLLVAGSSCGYPDGPEPAFQSLCLDQSVARTRACESRNRRAGEQNGPHRLGHPRSRRRLLPTAN
jgi:transposase